MSLITWLYLIDVVGGFDEATEVVAICSLVVGGVILIVAVPMLLDLEPGAETWKLWRRILAGAAASALIFGTLSLAIPSEKTLYLMLGAKTTQDIIANPKVQETGGKVLDLINKKLEEYAEVEKKK